MEYPAITLVKKQIAVEKQRKAEGKRIAMPSPAERRMALKRTAPLMEWLTSNKVAKLAMPLHTFAERRYTRVKFN